MYDVVIIGSGPGGYVAAIRAAQLNLRVALVESAELGGTCLNWGCIPTKALLHAAEVYTLAKNAYNFGIHVSEVSFALDEIVNYSRDAAHKLSQGITYLMKKNNVSVYKGKAKITAQIAVQINTEAKNTILESKNIIIATGAKVKQLPDLTIDDELIWGWKKAMTPPLLPKTLLIIGAGAIGIEFASFYNALGIRVIVVERRENILPTEDHEIAQLVQKALSDRGVEFHLNSSIEEVQKHATHVTANIVNPSKRLEIRVDRVILAIGISGNSNGLGLENTHVKVDQHTGFITTDAYMCTHEKNIYAIGDVVGHPCLAHKASHEGVLAAEVIADKVTAEPINKDHIPRCIYSMPQMASIGLTEEQARELKGPIKIGRFKASGNGKAVVLGNTFGMVKVIFGKESGELLGAHIIGENATELIQGYIIGQKAEITDIELRNTIFPHPTLSEMMHEAVLAADNESIHSS